MSEGVDPYADPAPYHAAVEPLPDHLAGDLPPAKDPTKHWERVCYELSRIEVPGGWLYKSDQAYGIALAFVPNNH